MWIQIGDWSRWLTDLFGIDDDDPYEDENDYDYPDEKQDKASSKSFFLLNALSDLMMLPKDMLFSRSTRKEVRALNLYFVLRFHGLYLQYMFSNLSGMPCTWHTINQKGSGKLCT